MPGELLIRHQAPQVVPLRRPAVLLFDHTSAPADGRDGPEKGRLDIRALWHLSTSPRRASFARPSRDVLL
jgi:hypothetical protein